MASRDKTRAVGVEPWYTEWATEWAAEALRYLGCNYPESLENLRVLDEHEEASCAASSCSEIGKATSRHSEAT